MKISIAFFLLGFSLSTSAQLINQDLATKLEFQSDTIFYKNDAGDDCFKVTMPDMGNDLLLTGLTQLQYWSNHMEDTAFLEQLNRLDIMGYQLKTFNSFLLDSILWLKNDSLVRIKDYSLDNTPVELLWQRGYFLYGKEMIDLDEGHVENLPRGLSDQSEIRVKPSIEDFYELKPMYKGFEATFDYINSSDTSLTLNVIISNGEKEFSQYQTILPWDTLQLSVLDTLNTKSYHTKIEAIDTSSKITYYQADYRIDGYHIHMKDFYKQESEAEDNSTYNISRNEPLRIGTLPNHHLMRIFRKDRLVSTIPTRSIIHSVDFSDYRKGEYVLEVTDLSNNDKIYHTILLTK